MKNTVTVTQLIRACTNQNQSPVLYLPRTLVHTPDRVRSPDSGVAFALKNTGTSLRETTEVSDCSQTAPRHRFALYSSSSTCCVWRCAKKIRVTTALLCAVLCVRSLHYDWAPRLDKNAAASLLWLQSASRSAVLPVLQSPRVTVQRFTIKMNARTCLLR